MKKDIALVYMAAGISSRFGGKIKQFSEVGPNGESLIEYSLKQAVPAGFTKIIFIVGNKTEIPFKEKFGNFYNGIPIYYALQIYDEKERDRPWGTGDAFCSIKNFIDCPFVICNGDQLYGKDSFKILFDHLQKHNFGASIGYKLSDCVPNKGKVNRGIFKHDENLFVKKIIETFNIEKDNLKENMLKESDLCNGNIFALYPETIDKINSKLDDFKELHQGDRKIEFLLPVELSNLIEENELKMALYPPTENWIEITNPDDEDIMRKAIRKHDN